MKKLPKPPETYEAFNPRNTRTRLESQEHKKF